jgi:hypothetical protein
MESSNEIPAQDFLWVACRCVLKGTPVAFINPEAQVITCEHHMDPASIDPEDFVTIHAGCARERGILPDDPETAAYALYVKWCMAHGFKPQPWEEAQLKEAEQKPEQPD